MDGIKVNERLKEQYIEKGYWTHETLLDRFYRTCLLYTSYGLKRG